MKVVTTHNIVTDWKKTFNFTDDEFAELKIGKLKVFISQEVPECRADCQQLFHKSTFLSNDDDLVKNLLGPSNSNAITIQYFVNSNMSGLNLKVDQLSSSAASEWNQQNSSFSSAGIPDPHKVVINRMSQTFTVPVEPAVVAPVDPPIKWFNLALLLRTIITCVVYLYTGKGEITTESKLTTAVAGVFIYLIHIGAMKMWAKKFFHYVMEKYFRLDRNNEYIDPNGVPPVTAAPQVAQAGAAAPPARRLAPEAHFSRRIQSAIETVSTVIKEGVTVPKAPGMVNDVLAVCIGLVGSLFPRWTADGAPILTF